MSREKSIKEAIAQAERRQKEAINNGLIPLAAEIESRIKLLVEDLKFEHQHQRQLEANTNERKKVKVLKYLPPVASFEEAENIKVHTCKLDTPAALAAFLSTYKGRLYGFSNDLDEVDFDSIDENHTYRVKSAFYDASLTDAHRRQVDDKVLELEVGMAIKRTLDAENPGLAHLHHNEHLGNREFDGIVVHAGNENQDSDAYIIECGYNPGVKKVASVFDKIKRFEAHYKNAPHFATVKKIIPVFGARVFSDAATQYCVDNKIWQVKPNGFGYQVVRYFSQMMKKLK